MTFKLWRTSTSLSTSSIIANQNVLQQQHVDWKISNALLKKGTRDAYKTWNQQDRAWVDMRLHEQRPAGPLKLGCPPPLHAQALARGPLAAVRLHRAVGSGTARAAVRPAAALLPTRILVLSLRSRPASSRRTCLMSESTSSATESLALM